MPQTAMVIRSDFMTVLQAAKALGYTPQHTRLLLRQKKLSGVKAGRDWLVLRDAVAQYDLEMGTVPLLPSKRGGRPASRRIKIEPVNES